MLKIWDDFIGIFYQILNLKYHNKTIKNRLLPRTNYNWSDAKMIAWGETPNYRQKSYKTFIENNPYDMF